MNNSPLSQIPSDVYSLLVQSAERFPKKIAIQELDGGAISYTELLDKVSDISLQLYSLKRKRIAIVVPNGLHMTIALLSSMCAGIAVPVNPNYTKKEYIDYFSAARVEILLFFKDINHPANAVAGSMGIPCIDLEVLRQNKSEKDKTNLLPHIKPADLAVLMLTSGSTGKSKVVPLSHQNICISAGDVCRSLDLATADRCLSMWEQYHIGGVVDLLLAPLLSGGTIISAGSFDAAQFFKALDTHKPTWFQCVPATLNEICIQASRTGNNTSNHSLRFLRCVAAALPELWRAQARQQFKVPIVRTFGMTEASPLIASTGLQEANDKPGSVGISCGTHIDIKGLNGCSLPACSVGEVAIRGRNIFSGYEGDDELNHQCFINDWFYTGDLGYLDEDGYLFLTGRARDIINRGGEKISPAEVEDVFLLHPYVQEATVFANPHRTLGQDVGIALVIKDGKDIDPQQLTEFAASRLAEFKIPKAWLFLEILPKNFVGKVLRDELPELYRQKNHDKSNLNIQPVDQLEQMVLDIWRFELDNSCLIMNDDFHDNGGDSLSRLRIVDMVSRELRQPLSLDVFLHCDTPSAMVMKLRSMGIGNEVISSCTAEIKPEMPSFASKVSDGQDNARLLFHAENLTEFTRIRHDLGALTTPLELKHVLNMSTSVKKIFAQALASPVLSYKLISERSRLRRAINNDYANSVNPDLWVRTQLSEHAYLFSVDNVLPESVTLIVGFTSRAMRLTAPTYQILYALDPSRHALLLFRDPSGGHYEEGIPGIGKSIEAVSDWLGNSPLINSFGRKVALGTSAGAVPSLIVTLRNNFACVLACGADTPVNHPLLDRSLRVVLDNLPQPEPRISIAFSALNKRDQIGAQELALRLPSARIIPDFRFRQHALLNELQKRGELKQFLETHLLMNCSRVN